MERETTYLLCSVFKDKDPNTGKNVQGPFLKDELDREVLLFSETYQCEIKDVIVVEEEKFKHKFPITYKYFFTTEFPDFLECFLFSIKNVEVFSYDPEKRILYSRLYIINIDGGTVNVSFSIHSDSSFVSNLINELNKYVQGYNVNIVIGKEFYKSPLDKKIYVDHNAYNRFLTENFLMHKERLN